jgi:hypothetical protein
VLPKISSSSGYQLLLYLPFRTSEWMLGEDSAAERLQFRRAGGKGSLKKYSLCLVSLVIAVGITTLYSIYISPCGTSWNDGIYSSARYLMEIRMYSRLPLQSPPPRLVGLFPFSREVSSVHQDVSLFSRSRVMPVISLYSFGYLPASPTPALARPCFLSHLGAHQSH